MKLSVIIPARNEAAVIGKTLDDLAKELKDWDTEIIVVDDHSVDGTWKVAREHKAWLYFNIHEAGIGRAIKIGLKWAHGDIVAIFMADGSDNPKDLEHCARLLRGEPYLEAVFGSRWTVNSMVDDYPLGKYILNRAFNHFISWLFGLRYTDTTNAFKVYRDSTLKGITLEANDFSILAELPLKVMLGGARYAITSIDWTNRKKGRSKFKIRELGSRYLWTIAKIWWNQPRPQYERSEAR